MVSVRINGEDSNIRGEGQLKIADIIELIKANIDPDHMITSILLDGRELADDDWGSNVTKYGTAILEIATGTPEEFVVERMSQCSNIVRSCFIQFRDARKAFQSGDMARGNQLLIQAVGTAKAFFEWYGTMLELTAPEKKAQYDITTQVTEIADICKRICQQQLYQSWWALGETLEKELEPKLDGLEDFLRKFAQPIS